jgi:hypothetical protein
MRVDVAWVANAPGVHHLIVLVLKQMAAAAVTAESRCDSCQLI